MSESCRRIRAVAANTFLEAVRQKVFAVILIFGLVLLGGANYPSKSSSNSSRTWGMPPSA